MEATTHQSKSAHFFQQLKVAGQHTLDFCKGIFYLGRETRAFVERVFALSETVDLIQSQAVEIEALNQKIHQLELEHEADHQTMAALNTKLYKDHCQLVLLKRGQRFSSRQAY